MAYFNDHDLELYSKSAGLAGEVFNPSNRLVSEYLAVVNTNVAGGKSDAFVNQKIDFKSTIDETGEITNVITVTRKHAGEKEKEWWYKATNKNYLQIYTTIGSRVTVVKGQDVWPKIKYPNYTSGYTTVSNVQDIENTVKFLDEFNLNRFIAFDKTVFSAWLNTPAGKTKSFTMTYKNPRKLEPSAQIPYEFIFEKQSGASTTLSIAIDAPPEYKWKESNSANLIYESSDPPGRLRIRQTLIPIK
jgi:hypothetical protein